MGFKSYLETLQEERKQSARSVADYFNRIGKPATVNKLGEAVQTAPTANRPRTLSQNLAIRGVATDETLRQMHRENQSRFDHPHLNDVLGEKRQRFQQLRKMGIIPTPAERNVFFEQVVFPVAQKVWEKSGDDKILLKPEKLSAADVERIGANAPTRRAAASDPVVKADHQARKDDFAYWRSLRTALLNRRAHRAKAEPKTARVTPTKNSLQRRLF